MIYNITKKKILSRKPKYYLKGFIALTILFKENFKHHDSVVLQNKKILLTCFLKLNMDVVLADNENRVIDCLDSNTGRKFYLTRENLSTIIFLPPGSISEFKIDFKDQLNLNAELTSECKRKLKAQLHGAIAPSSTFMSKEES